MKKPGPHHHPPHQHQGLCDDVNRSYSRRDFLRNTSLGIGGLALASLIDPLMATKAAGERLAGAGASIGGGVLGVPHHRPTAKRIIYLLQSGAPSHLDLFDYKPLLNQRHGEDLPDSVRKKFRSTGMSSGQAHFPMVGTPFEFAQHGSNGAWFSDRLPHMAAIADEFCVIKSMYTEAVNHDPAVTFLQTGSQFPGRPAMGAWMSYGLGSTNENLPSFVVLVTKNKVGSQPLYSRLWGNAFLPSEHQGVQFRAGKDPVLYLKNPPGVSEELRREQLDAWKTLQAVQEQDFNDPEIVARTAQYEMAFRMQTSVPEIMDVSGEPDHVYEMYGEDSRTPGTFAANALLARRLAEKDVPFIQLYHQGWDHHGDLPNRMRQQTLEVDQASAALIKDLKQRGMLDDTLVIWGGEFGRTAFSQGMVHDNFGRDHHGGCFTMLMAGGGVKAGLVHGATDEFGVEITEKPVHIHDFQATVMHTLGIDHERLTFKHQGRRFRLTDVHGHVQHDLLA